VHFLNTKKTPVSVCPLGSQSWVGECRYSECGSSTLFLLSLIIHVRLNTIFLAIVVQMI